MQTAPMAIFNDNLRKALATKNVTITDFAEQIGMPREALSKIINGRCDPTTGTLARIADGLGTTLHELFAPPDIAVKSRSKRPQVA